MLLLLCVALRLILQSDFIKFCLPFCPCVSNPFSIAITSLGEERADLCAFRVYCARVGGLCRFPLPLSVRD